MCKLMIVAALASTAIATPAMARDNSVYVGLDGGVLIPRTTKFEFHNSAITIHDGVQVAHKTGYDIDGVGGYDFGMFRIEGEVSFKRAPLKRADLAGAALAAVLQPSLPREARANGHASITSGMLNGLVDIGSDDLVNFSLGAGIGLAKARYNLDLTPTSPLNFEGSDNALAFQALAEIRTPLSSNVDLGVKGRYFETARLHLGTF
jgi:opacity protein-like surface antigen